MAEFLQLMEQLRDELPPVGNSFDDGFVSVHGPKPANWNERVVEATRVLANAYNGGFRAQYRLREALTTSDFPLLFGDIIDRQVLMGYQEAPYSWSAWARKGTVSDFRAVKRFRIDGAESTFTEVVQQGPYPESSIGDNSYTYTLKKYGRKMPFAWETMINDDLDALKDVPARFGRAARRSEEKFATGLIATSSGPDGTFFTTGHKNLCTVAQGAVTANAPVGIAGLQDMMTVLFNMVDYGGDPIDVEGLVWVVPPAQYIAAMNVLHATQLIVGASTDAQRILTSNWIAANLKVVKNSYLPIIDTTSGNKAHYLFADPSVSRPAVEIGFLRGHEQPEIFMKAPNSIRVGSGGDADPMNGDFNNDSLEYKVRHVYSGVTLDYKAAVASTGAGS
jgi:hypothetical protein